MPAQVCRSHDLAKAPIGLGFLAAPTVFSVKSGLRCGPAPCPAPSELSGNDYLATGAPVCTPVPYHASLRASSLCSVTVGSPAINVSVSFIRTHS